METETAGRVFLGNVFCAAALFVAFLPTLITKKVIFGHYLQMGYENLWNWKSPAFFEVCVSADHGLFSWHPILLLAVAGLFILSKHDRRLGLYLLGVFVALVYTIGCDRDWDGLSSFGNRYFVSITPLFVLGLAASFDWLARVWQERRTAILASSTTAVLILWNLGLIFQWGTHLIPPRGAISWRQAAYNQVAVVPEQAASTVKAYFTRRTQLMDRIEREDVKHLKARQSEASE